MVALRWMRSGLVVTILALLITAQVSIADEEKDYEGDPDMDMDTPDTVAETQETPDDETTDDPNDNEDMYTNTDGAVKELMWDDWIETVVEEEELPWLVNFYATWCGHCKKMVDLWVGLARSLTGVLKVGAVNCANDKNKNLQTLYGSKGYPSIYFFPAGARRKPKYFPYGRDLNTLVDFALGSMPTLTAQVNTSSLAEFQQTQPEVPKILLFTTNMVPPNVYNALAFHYRMRLVFGQANNETGAELITKYKIKKYPQLIVLPFEGRKKWKRYDGKMDYGPLRDFLDTLALDERVGDAKVESFYNDFWIPPDFQNLPRLEAASFNETIIKGEKPSVVFLYHFWSYPSKFWIPNIEKIYLSGEFSDSMDMYCISMYCVYS
jgi:thiol-disulfide isomerase/thioredoxin